MNKISTLQDLEEIKKRVRPLLAVREDTNFAKFKEARQIDVLVVEEQDVRLPVPARLKRRSERLSRGGGSRRE